MTDFRSYAAEYDDAHDKIDDEHEVLKGMFDRLRKDLRMDGRDKTEVQQLMGQFKELMAARRKFGPTLDGYMAKSERIDHFNVEIFGGLIPTAAKKRTSDNPKPVAGPSNGSLARARDEVKPKGQSAEHNMRSAPVAAVGGEGSGDQGPTAATNSPSVGTPLQGRPSHATGHTSQASVPSGVTSANKAETARVDRLEGQDNGAGNNSNAPAISAPSDSRAAATSNIGVGATVSDGDIRGSFLDRSLWA